MLTSESGERGSVAASTGIAMGAQGYPVMSGWETTPEPISASTPYPRETREEVRIDDSSYLWSGVAYPQVSSVQSLITQTTSVYTMGRPLLSTGVVSGPPASEGGTTRRGVQDMDVTTTHGRIWLPMSLPSRGSRGLSLASVSGGDERLRNMDPSPAGGYTTGQSRIIQPVVRPKLMSNYDGRSSWSDYLVQFQIAARLNHWSEEEKAMELATSLVGQARGVLSDMSEQDRLDYGALVQKLSLRFEPVDLEGMYQSQLRGRKHKHNESLPELAQDIGKLTRQAFPTADETTYNYMAVTSFISALGNEQQELFVYQRDSKTVEEAGKAAMAFETFQAARPSKTPFLRMQYGQPPSTGGHQSDQDDSIKQLLDWMTLLEQGQMPSVDYTEQSMSSPQFTQLVNRLEKLEKAQRRGTFSGQQALGQRSGNRNSDRRPGNCHYCGIPGHWQNECQKRQRDQARGTAPLESGQPQLSAEEASVHPPTTGSQAMGNSQ